MDSSNGVADFLNTDQVSKLGKTVLAKWKLRPEDISDIIQEACLSAWQSRERYSSKDGGSVSAWFCTIVNRRAIDWIKQSRRQPIPTEIYDSIPAKPPESEVDKKMAEEIIDLPGGDLFRLYAGGVPQKGIALMFGMTLAHVQTKTWRFREAFRG